MSEERLIVVAAEDACGFDGKISAHLGRCPFFLLAEANGSTVTVSEVVPNPHLGANQPGAVPRFIRDMGANVIIAGGMGQGATEIFHGFGIDVAAGATGTVAMALGAYLRRERREAVSCVQNLPDSSGGRGPRMGGSDG
jgi:predicted Fe-Mo cluster-binding NifX family protein